MRADARPGRLWAITSYFNPVSYRRRLANYRVFRARLGLPLLTVELAYGATPELGDGDADILVQLRGGDVMWQKERLLNLAVRALPESCDRVVWIDCDTILGDDAWAERIDRSLDAFALVQGFSRAHQLAPDWQTDMSPSDAVAFSRPSLGKAIADGLAPGAYFDPFLPGETPNLATGLAWAARRELLERHPLYDVAVVGSGDRLIAAAAFDRIDGPVTKYGIAGPRLRHYADWAQAWRQAVGGSIGVIEGDIFALWHGTVADRRYSERQVDFSGFDFDPATDIALDAQGVWRWSSDKPAMHAYVRDYFVARREDG